ncbi:hypothetical protein ROZALSC1DRAFT_28971 [Rozella allomycis CSF55]|uniref:FAR1 domain-containing protein n=1 Tax=Rozella allomycis (strain CSF55) TaxID=988480 RepID=A0A075B538_ROZAC|nr:hypothetical protein O9G_005083 [Rozella allomycis CSF55]RKP19428.1 hypothetical protein ROZALSC1DRAFT_28971 [Rozella allomycis CSF55]|eukprot:EPZ36713.1 hypothetical protein O9G_005083 [Rozella allomycis CSF55]
MCADNNSYVCDPSYVSHMNEYVSAVGELELTSVAIKERILNESKSLGYALSVVRTDKNIIILGCSRSKYPSCLARVRISTYKAEIGKIALHVFDHNHPPSDKVTTFPDNVDDAIRSFIKAQMKFVSNTYCHTGNVSSQSYPYKYNSDKMETFRKELRESNMIH